MNVDFDHCDLAQHFLLNFRFLTLKGIWILKDGNEFAGISFVLAETKEWFNFTYQIPGYISVRGREIELQFEGRRNYCTWCRSKNNNGHTTDACTRRHRG